MRPWVGGQPADVTLVGNDTGPALVQLLMCHRRPWADLGNLVSRAR
jgi:hypothetical protein